MKTSRFSKILGVVILAAVAITLSEISPAKGESSGSFAVKDLPPVVLEKCIKVQQLIGRNPFSAIPNDYLLVTKYEEKTGEAGATKEGLIPGRAFNIYLAHDFLLSESRKTGAVHDSALIVKVSTTDAKTSRKTVREWILIDRNGDQKIDQGFFRETVTGKGKSLIGSNEAVFPRERLPELQAYYEKAAATLGSKAAEKTGEGCLII